jgi:hypothetical protein
MDRLLAFYARVFDAEITLDMTEAGLRHAGPLGGGLQGTEGVLKRLGSTSGSPAARRPVIEHPGR